MGVLGSIVGGVVSTIQGMTVTFAVLMGVAIWMLPLGVTPVTKFVVSTMVVAAVYDDVIIGEQGDFGPFDLALSGAVGVGLMKVVG